MSWEEAQALLNLWSAGCPVVECGPALGERLPWSPGMFAVWCGRHLSAAGVPAAVVAGERSEFSAHGVRHVARRVQVAARPTQGGRGRGALPSSFFTKRWKGGSYVAHSARD